MKWICTLPLILSGCSLISLDQTSYKRDLGAPVQKPELSFQSKEALALGATLANVTAAEIYYKGTPPESKEAKRVYDMTYRFLALAGVNNGFDPGDPESVAMVFEKADQALVEKDRLIHQLQVDVKDKLAELATKTKIIRDKEDELERKDGQWKLSFAGLKFWLKMVIGGIIGFAALLFILQIWTGIPFFSAAIGGVTTLYKATHQTVQGIQEIREKLKVQDPETLKLVDQALEKYQDSSVKTLVRKLKNGS